MGAQPRAEKALPGGRREYGCARLAKLAELRNPCRLWPSSLLGKPPGRAFSARGCASSST
jgi:hypothetical protein